MMNAPGPACSARNRAAFSCGVVIFTHFALGPHPQRLPAPAPSLAPVDRSSLLLSQDEKHGTNFLDNPGREALTPQSCHRRTIHDRLSGSTIFAATLSTVSG